MRDACGPGAAKIFGRCERGMNFDGGVFAARIRLCAGQVNSKFHGVLFTLGLKLILLRVVHIIFSFKYIAAYAVWCNDDDNEFMH